MFALVQVGSVQDSGHHEAKVGSEGVDGHGASGVLSLNQKVSHDSSEKSPNEGFSGRFGSLTPSRDSRMNSFTANSVTSNMAMVSSWIGLVLPRTAPKEMSTEPVQKSALIMLREERKKHDRHLKRTLADIPLLDLPLHANVDLASMHAVEEALHQSGPLQGKSCDQEVEANATEAIPLQEGHEEAKADEDHHMNILETCREHMNTKWSKNQPVLVPQGTSLGPLMSAGVMKYQEDPVSLYADDV